MCYNQTSVASSFDLKNISGLVANDIIRGENCSYAIAGKRSGKPWLLVTGQKGQHILNETYDSDFPDVTSKFGNGLPAKGSLELSATTSGFWSASRTGS